MKVKMTKDPYGLGSLMTNFPKSWQSQTKSLLGIPMYFTGCHMNSSG